MKPTNAEPSAGLSPTPWRIVESSWSTTLIIDAAGRMVCEISDEEGLTPADEANAALLGNAPALLAACEQANTLIGHLLKSRAIREDEPTFDWNLLNAVMCELPEAISKAKES